PYVYCANNPIKLVDPNGEEITDYFDQHGKYLGTDCVDDGKIRIIQDNLWNKMRDGISCEGNDGTCVISQGLGEIIADKPSSLNLSDEAIQNIVGHYNNIGLKLHKGKAGALRIEFNGNERSYSPKLTINLEQWKNNVFLDNYYDITSTYDHEKGHIKQCEKIGIKAFSELTEYQQEKYAIDYQKSQPAFSKASNRYKKYVDVYLQSKNR
ncbi:MAG: hypothetical protein MJZ46_05795, partial [Bacteroidales bacterium]|nr:hypothetical protein [Bacteroidales bacterium]